MFPICERCRGAEAVARVQSFEGDQVVLNIVVCSGCLNAAIQCHLTVTTIANGEDRPRRRIEANSLNLENGEK